MQSDITNDKLTFKIDTTEPIYVNDLIRSLKSISTEYSSLSELKNVEVKVSEVRKGSHIFDLILASTAPLLPIIDNATTTVEFIKKVFELKELFLNNSIDCENESKPSIGQAKMINSLSNHSQNVYNGCSIHIYDNNHKEEIVFNKEESKILLINSSKYITQQKQLEKKEKEVIQKDRVLKFVQRRFDNKDKGNKSVCEFITKNEITTVFNNNEIRNEILDNATEYLFVVDIEVQYSDNKPILYKVLKLNDKIDLDKE